MANDLMIANDAEYQKWIKEVKELVHVSQLKAAVQVNTEMIHMYWCIGKEISVKHADSVWGSGFYGTMSQSMKEEFPSVKGFSVTNLKYMKRFYEFYTQDEKRQQLVDDLENICMVPWGHHILIMTKCKTIPESVLLYAKRKKKLLLNMPWKPVVFQSEYLNLSCQTFCQKKFKVRFRRLKK